MATDGRLCSAKGGQVGIATKKSAARAKSEARSSGSRNTERPAAAKRASEPAATKKRAKTVPPPAADAANDNDRVAKKSVPPPAKAPATSAMGRGRLPTGSLHTEARQPQAAESIKARLTALIATQQKLGELKRSANKNFYEIGRLLHKVREERLFEVKGYGSFESFIEREVSIGQQFCLTAVRIFEVFQPAVVQQLGLTRLSAAVRALDDEAVVAAPEPVRGTRSPIPPHKL